MTATDPVAAIERLIALMERAAALGARDQPAADDSIRAPILSYSLAQLRMRVRPALERAAIGVDPLHVALFGGTNTGKSTVLNVLLGRVGASMGVRARYSQHPEAYRPGTLGDGWLDGSASRFANYRRYRDEHPPRQTDDELRRDGYRPALAVLDPTRLAGPEFAPPAAAAAVLWDAPDFSTEQAGTYMSAVLDLLALADLIIMTVTDESYADDRGTAFLRMVSESDVAKLMVANKLPDNPALLEDVARTLDAAGRSRAPVLRLPDVAGSSPSARLENLIATPEAAWLRAAVHEQAEHADDLKLRALRGAIQFIERHFEAILKPLSDEASVAQEWGRTVERLARELIVEPYRSNYLEGVRYGEFNRTLLHLMELLRVPWIGPVLEATGHLMRTPLRLAVRGVRRLVGRPEPAARQAPEQEVLDAAIGGWLAAIKSQAQLAARAQSAPDGWDGVVRALDDPRFRQELGERFGRAFAAYRVEIDDEARRRAEALYRKLQENPRKLAALRSANLLVSAASVALVIKTAGLDWSDAVLGPVVTGLWQNLLAWGLGRYLETLRTELKQVQLRAVSALVEADVVAPARDLFRATVGAADLDVARQDLSVVTNAAIGRVERTAT